jgi:hypothetical protein
MGKITIIWRFYQGQDMTNTGLLDKFQTCVAIFNQFRWDTLGRDYTAIKNELEVIGIVDTMKAMDNQKIVAADLVRHNYLAVAYIVADDKTRYGEDVRGS